MSQLRTLCWNGGAERDLNESRRNEGEFESEERAYRRGSWRDSGLKKETLALLMVFISLFGRNHIQNVRNFLDKFMLEHLESERFLFDQRIPPVG